MPGKGIYCARRPQTALGGEYNFLGQNIRQIVPGKGSRAIIAYHGHLDQLVFSGQADGRGTHVAKLETVIPCAIRAS